MRNPGQGDHVTRTLEQVHRLFHAIHRRDGIRRADDRQIRRPDVGGGGVVLTEGRQKMLSGVRYIADNGFDTGILDSRMRILANKAVREPCSQQLSHRGSAHARPESADLVGIDVRSEIRIGQEYIDGGPQRHRPQRLHFDKVIEVAGYRYQVGDIADMDDGKARVAVKRRGDDITKAGQAGDCVQHVGVEGTAGETMGHHQQGQKVGIVLEWG